MATYVKAVLPSGRGLWLEKLTTRQYRAVTERVASRLGENATGAQVSSRLGHEMLLQAFRGVTASVLPVQMTAGEAPEMDIDAMLAAADDWVRPTYEELIITDGSRSLETLLEDPADYLVAEDIATNETLGGRSGAMRGKVRREFGAQSLS